MLMYQIYLRKKDFSYNCWDRFEKFKEGLPNKDKCYNTLTNRAMSDKNYEKVSNVWKVFKMNNMKDYQGLYL